MDSEDSVSEKQHRHSRRGSPLSNAEDPGHEAQAVGKTSSKRSRSKRSRERGHEDRRKHTSSHRPKSHHSDTRDSAALKAEQREGDHVRHKKRRARSGGEISNKFTETPITAVSAVLHELQDVIEDSSPTNLHGAQQSVYHIPGDSEPYTVQKGRDCVYVEHYDGFSSVSRDHALAGHSTSHFNQDKRWFDLSTASALDVAIVVQKMWLPLADFCHGLLAGMALMQAVLVDRLLGLSSGEAMQFIPFYSKFSLVFTTTFYFLTSVCLVSVLDRLGFARGDWPSLMDLLSVRPKIPWLLIPIYIGGLILTLCAAREDDWIYLYQFNSTKDSFSQDELDMLSSWHVLNSLRCACVVVGWLLISANHPPDLLLHLLLDMLPLQNIETKHKVKPHRDIQF